MFGGHVQETLTLGGDGGGVFDLDTRGAVTLTVTPVTTAGSPAAEVADALARRAPTLTPRISGKIAVPPCHRPG